MKNLQATLQGTAPAIDPAAVLQLIEGQRLSGTFRMGDHSLRLRGGQVCHTSSDPVETVAGILGARGAFTFRAVAGEPTGELALSVTGLLLEAARIADEAQVAAA